ncbi:adenosine deaminase, partial [bacterium]
MDLERSELYRALAARDARFDGLFFVGVSSTGVYCRPVCTARTPREENCSFHKSAASAERAGFRPCLVCRPELAPGRARVDVVGRLADAAVRRLEDGAEPSEV